MKTKLFRAAETGINFAKLHVIKPRALKRHVPWPVKMPFVREEVSANSGCLIHDLVLCLTGIFSLAAL